MTENRKIFLGWKRKSVSDGEQSSKSKWKVNFIPANFDEWTTYFLLNQKEYFISYKSVIFKDTKDIILSGSWLL